MVKADNSTRKHVGAVPLNKTGARDILTSDLRQLRSAVAVAEDEDARLTGMTRSLDRRLLALNLQSIPPAGELSYLKVA